MRSVQDSESLLDELLDSLRIQSGHKLTAEDKCAALQVGLI
jgi:hypothetical protein